MLRETVGVGIAVGTVLGLSTLPFYDKPASRLKNLAVGAGIGAVIGLGLLAHESLGGDDHANATGTMNPFDPDKQTRSLPPVDRFAGAEDTRRVNSLLSHTIWMPVLSLAW